MTGRTSYRGIVEPDGIGWRVAIAIFTALLVAVGSVFALADFLSGLAK